MSNDHDPQAGDQTSNNAKTDLPGKRPSGCILVPMILLCIVYLVNPTAGFIELIPDTFPVIGNLYEAGAVLLLLKCLGYYGVNLDWLLARSDKKKKAAP